MSLADYLAKNYLTADASTDKKGRKRKRKSTQTPTTGLFIADDDALGWNSNNGTSRDDDDGPMTGKTHPLSPSTSITSKLTQSTSQWA